MNKLTFLSLLFVLSCTPKTEINPEVQNWEKRAENVSIVRDTYGVPHIYGKTDADVVFGLLYAQCEDDFNRVEMNYINAMGRLAEHAGEGEIYRDLRMKLFIDPEDMKSQYESSPEWLKSLMNAFADGINYYLHTHPEVTPKVIKRFEPWMALSFSEGSIGGDIERVNIRRLRDFYGERNEVATTIPNEVMYLADGEPRGSNGFSIAPSNTKNGNTLFLINPHTSFFFRAEVHMVSEEGLNAYGAVTWGQFFVYQGFNERLGWMHTSSRADAIDEYLESIEEREDGVYYKHGEDMKLLESKTVYVTYKGKNGPQERSFEIYRSHHGPIVRKEDGKWVSMSIMERPVDALRQSYLRTKATNYEEFYKTMEIRTNSSNNTVYADADGNIAYFHGNYIPIRDTSFDWTKPLDGSNPATDYKGLHEVDEMVLVKNPENGWIQNCNSTPFTAAGKFSPKRSDYPSYIAPDSENFRGIHAVRVLEGKTDFTLESLKAAAYDSYLPAFEEYLPTLMNAFGKSSDNELKEEVMPAIEALRAWDYRFGEESVATSIAIYWATEMEKQERSSVTDDSRLTALKDAMNILKEGFGKWDTAWGEINRYQRLTGDIVQSFDDDKPSLPVGFASSKWGSLASFGARTYPGTKRMYGTSGNSFVAFVEFGEKLKALSISAGGESSDVNSPHFDDQALMYTKGEFKEVRFYPEEVKANSEKTYYPGSK